MVLAESDIDKEDILMKHCYELKSEKIILKPLEEKDIESLRVLRNQASKFFITQKYITKEQQKQWYKTYLYKQNDYMFKVVLCSNPNEFVGAVALYDVDKEKGTAEFGRIVVDNKKAQGIGKDIVNAICKFGYEELGLVKIVCTVFKDNEKAVQIYKKIGFEVMKEKDGLLYMEKYGARHM